MRASALKKISPVQLRPADLADIDRLLDLESQVFPTDRLSRRSLRRLIASKHATLVVAEQGDRFVGYALVLFRNHSAVARLYSLAVEPSSAGNGVGRSLLAAAEDEAIRRDCLMMRLEVREDNERAIAVYRKGEYREIGRRQNYYQDGSNAIRMEKRLLPPLQALKNAPRYFHQTTEFTCGPACLLMALGWGDPNFEPSPITELQLWRQATTIFMTSGPGGCEPYGMAVALKENGLDPEVYVTRPGPYFLETARSLEKRRVMQLAQSDFRRQADALGIRSHLTRADESVLMGALDAGSVAIILVSGYHMIPRGAPHWVFAFGHDERYVLVHDPAALKDDWGRALAAETYAVPWSVFDRMTRVGRDDLGAAIVIRKG